MRTSRRDFLYAAGTTAGLAVADRYGFGQETPPATAAGSVRVRKDIATLNANSPDVKALTAAVAKMKDPNAGLPACQTWAGWSAIHGTVTGGFNKCQHNNWYIWPWHRMYVYYFEQLVIQLSGYAGFALPYWNWSKNPTIPALFWQGPLLDPNRSVAQGQPIPPAQFNQFISPTVIANILNIPGFPALGGTASGSGELESRPHNFIHNWIGGDMGTGGSPTDPIFWMHHCNCDRLYSAWINKHPKGLPTAAAWLNREFNDFCGKGMKVSQTSDAAKLGYTYDKLTPTAALVAAAAPQLPAVTETEGPTATDRTTAGAALVFTLKPKPAAATAINRLTAGAVDPRAASARLDLHGVKVPANQNVRVSVFINAPNPTADLDATSPHHVASFTFFHGGHAGGAKKDGHGERKDVKADGHKEANKDDRNEGKKGGHKGDGTVTLHIDATRTLQRLYGDQAFSEEEALNVQIVAAPLFPDRDGWQGTVQELSPSQVQLITTGPTGG